MQEVSLQVSIIIQNSDNLNRIALALLLGLMEMILSLVLAVEKRKLLELIEIGVMLLAEKAIILVMVAMNLIP